MTLHSGSIRALSGRIGARLVGAAAQALTLILVARSFGPEQFGALALTMAVGYLVAALTGFGTTNRALRVSAESGDQQKLLAAYANARVLSVTITSLVCLVLTLYLPELPVLLGILWLSLDNISEFAQSALAGQGRQNDSSVAALIQRFPPLVGILIGSTGWVTWQIPFCIGIIAAAIATLWLLRATIRPTSVRPAIRGSWGYLAAAFGSNVAQLELPVVRALTSASTFGSYSLATRTTNPLTIVGSAFQSVFVPELSRRVGTKAFSQVFRRIMTMLCLYAALLVLIAPVAAALISRLLGGDFRQAQLFVTVFFAAAALATVAQGLQARLFALGRPGRSASAVIGGVLLGLGYDVAVLSLASPNLLWTCPIVMHTCVLAFMIFASRRAGPRLD